MKLVVTIAVLLVLTVSAATEWGSEGSRPAAVAGPPTKAPLIAVAANFVDVAEELALRFEARRGVPVRITSGSTGQLYAQIVHGAPYAVFLAADRERPARLVDEGLAVAATRFTYARGRLALWSSAADAEVGEEALRAARMTRLAIANPDVAPYGAAAREVLVALGVDEQLRPRLVVGQSIAQAHAMVATGNAEMGFVALSSLRRPELPRTGRAWIVPADLHAPIDQDAVLLARAADDPVARDFLAFLRGPDARSVIEDFGYGVP